MEKVTEKQRMYAKSIADNLNIPLPEEETKTAYQQFIKENQERFQQTKTMAVHYTDEQINQANRVSILDYARSQGLELKKEGKDYRVKNYSGGFLITSEKNNWNWFSGDQGGGVVQLCMFLENKTWQEAVGTLLNEEMEPIRLAEGWKQESEPPKEFHLPEKNATNKHVYAYLTKTRCIDKDIVNDMLDKDYIYENRQRSCVFVGRDNEGIPRHASVRSTNTQGKVYKKDVSGSQKKYSFSISGTSGILNVFEAPIDAMSYMSIQKASGLAIEDAYVSLGGTTDKALERFLEDNRNISEIRVCTDGDEAGEKAAEKIREKYGKQYRISRHRSKHKDFNEDLVAAVQEKNFKRILHEVVTGKSKVSDVILVGTTPNILVVCGASKGLDFTISKGVIDKCTKPEIRDAEGKLVGKTGHGLTEEQLYGALMNVKEPVMVLQGKRENSLVVITEYPDDKKRPIVVSIVLDKRSGRTMINNVSSVYGRDKFEEYIQHQIQADNVLAIDNKKAELLLKPIGKWYPKREEAISYDSTIAYSMESVKYPENISQKGDVEEVLKQDSTTVEKMLQEKHKVDEEMDFKEWNLLLEKNIWMKLKEPRKLSPEFFDSPEIQDVQLLYELDNNQKMEIVEDKDYASKIPVGLPSEFYAGTVDGEIRLIFKENFADHEIFHTSRQATFSYMAGNNSLKGIAAGIYEDIPDLVSLTVDEEHINMAGILENDSNMEVESAINKKANELMSDGRNFPRGQFISFDNNVPYVKNVVNLEKLKEMEEDELKEIGVARNVVKQVEVSDSLTEKQTQVAIESTIDFVDPEIGFVSAATENLPAGTKYRLVTFGENGYLVPYQESDNIYMSRAEAQNYIEEHQDILEAVDYDEMVYQAGRKISEYMMRQQDIIDKGMHSFEFEDGYLYFSIDINDYSYDGLYRIYDPDNGKSREIVNIYDGYREPVIEENMEYIERKLDMYVNEHPLIGENGEEIPREKASIYCEWSEHDAFEGGRVYSVSEFNQLMKGADNEWRELREKEREQYGDEAFDVLREQGMPQHQGYAKVKYTVYVPGMEKLTLRQDVGDGFGGVIDYINLTSHAHYVEPLVAAMQQELKNQLYDEFKSEVKAGSLEKSTIIPRIREHLKNDFGVASNEDFNRLYRGDMPYYTIKVAGTEEFIPVDSIEERENGLYYKYTDIPLPDQPLEEVLDDNTILLNEDMIRSYYEPFSSEDLVAISCNNEELELTLSEQQEKNLQEQVSDEGKDHIKVLAEQIFDKLYLTLDIPEEQEVTYMNTSEFLIENIYNDLLNRRFVTYLEDLKMTIVNYYEMMENLDSGDRGLRVNYLDEIAKVERVLADLMKYSEDIDITDMGSGKMVLPDEITVSNFESKQPGTIDFDVHLGEDEIHKGQASIDDDGTVNWVFVEPKPLAVIRPGVEPEMHKINLQIDWDKLIEKVKEILQELRYKSKEFMRALGIQTSGSSYTQGVQPDVRTESDALKYEQQESEKAEVQTAASSEKMSNPDVGTSQSDMEKQFSAFAKEHKSKIRNIRESGKRIPIVINAFGGPGSGKTVSCMDICQQLKKLGYNAEYVQEYAKDLVYDHNLEMLDGSAGHQFEILKEQLKRMDRLYGNVDFIVTDSPLLLNGVYNKELTPEYQKMIDSISADFKNFTYFVERDNKDFQQEGRIHNLEESQKLDQEIKDLLTAKGIFYGTYSHEEIDKVVSNALRTYGNVNHLMEAPSEKQVAFAKKIAETLNLDIPAEQSKEAYTAFIGENVEAFNKSGAVVAKPLVSLQYEDYLEMVAKDGKKLKEVPKEHYTEELLLAAVNSFGAAIKYIPKADITETLAMASVKQYGTNLKHVPDELRTKDVCVAAYISSSGRSMTFTPKDIKALVREEASEKIQNDNTAYRNGEQLDEQLLKNNYWEEEINKMLIEHETDANAMAEDIAFAGRFYQYSAHNIQLMLRQNPGITYVGTAKKFEEMNYHIKPGEKPMVARIPVKSKYVLSGDEERIYVSDYTKEIKEAVKKGTMKEYSVVSGFKYVAAFYDISQTDCPPEDYPSRFHMGISSELHQNLFEAMKEFANMQGFRVEVVDLKSIALRGTAQPDSKIIRINDRLEPTMALSTLCHEIGHGLLHTSSQASKMTTAQKECEADVVSIMIMANLGLPIDDSRREHLLEHFTEYKKEQAAKEHPYEVTLKKLIDRVQVKVFRPYVENMNQCIAKHLPKGNGEVQAKSVAADLAKLDASNNMDHTTLFQTEKEIFQSDRVDVYADIYHQTYEETRLQNSFEPKLAVFRQLKTGEVYLCDVRLLDVETANMFRNMPSSITPEKLGYTTQNGDILVFRENLVSTPAIYAVEQNHLNVADDRNYPDIVEIVTGEEMLNKINSGFDVHKEYESLHALLQNNVKLEPEIQERYDRICDAFAYDRFDPKDMSRQFQARLNLITEDLSGADRELVAEYVFRTGNYEKASKYAEKLKAEPETSKQILTEMGILDSYKYMLWIVEEYESGMNLPENIRLTKGTYNGASIPVLNNHVQSLSQIDHAFVQIKKFAAPDRLKYYSICEGEGEYYISYVRLNGYRPEEVHSVPFNSYESAMDFYSQYLAGKDSVLVEENESLVNLERASNMISLTGATALANTVFSAKGELRQEHPELSEEELLKMFRDEVASTHPMRSESVSEDMQQELTVLKEFKRGITDKEHFMEINNLSVEERFASLEWLVDMGDKVGRLSIPESEPVLNCILSAINGNVTLEEINHAFDAVDSAVLLAEFDGLEKEFTDYGEYSNVFQTLKQTYVAPDVYCYVDYSDSSAPYLYTSDPVGNMYKKSLPDYSMGESVSDLYRELNEKGYRICTDFAEFRALSENQLINRSVPEEGKGEMYIRVLEHTAGLAETVHENLFTVYEFKQEMDKFQVGNGSDTAHVTYQLVIRTKEGEISYTDTYSRDTKQNVYEQLYEKVQMENPELSRMIAKQYYQDQISFHERHYVMPLKKKLDNAQGEDCERISGLLDTYEETNHKLQEEIRKLDLSPADADMLKLQIGNQTNLQSAELSSVIRQHQNKNQNKKIEQEMEMEIK